MNMNMNKIAGAVFLAGLIGMTTGKVTEFLYDGGPAHPGGAGLDAEGAGTADPTEHRSNGGGEAGGASNEVHTATGPVGKQGRQEPPRGRAGQLALARQPGVVEVERAAPAKNTVAVRVVVGWCVWRSGRGG